MTQSELQNAINKVQEAAMELSPELPWYDQCDRLARVRQFAFQLMCDLHSADLGTRPPAPPRAVPVPRLKLEDM